MYQETFTVVTSPHGLHDITSQANRILAKGAAERGLCHLFVMHTSASLLIQENADPAVLRDLERFFSSLVREDATWEHDDEGPDDMPAHVRSALTRTSETIPIAHHHLALGTWQAVYLWEHRAQSHRRQIALTAWGT